MTQLIDVEKRIVRDTGVARPTVIRDMLLDAVDFYQTTPFWFNVKSKSLTLTLTDTTGHSLDDYMSSLVEMLDLKVRPSSNPSVNVEEVTYEGFRRLNMNTQSTNPHWYCINGNTLHLWPRLDSTLTVVTTYVAELSQTDSSSSSTVWTNEAEKLVRLHAQANIEEIYNERADRAQLLRQHESAIFDRLRERTLRHHGGTLKFFETPGGGSSNVGET